MDLIIFLFLKNNKSNIEIVRLLKKGDMSAFDNIYSKYCYKLHGFVMIYLKQEEDAEEIVQKVFIKIWNSRNKIDVYASFESFLFTIAYNSTMSLLRKRITEIRSREYLKSLQQVEVSENVIDEMQYNELNDKIHSLLEQITLRQKEIFLLSREEGLTHKEIASKLKISESTVNNHLVTTLKFLKSHINSSLFVSALFFYLFLS